MQTDKIYIHGLEIETIIGCLPHEKIKSQLLVIDIELVTKFNRQEHNDDIKNVINYAEIVEVAQHFVKNSRLNLIETLAETLAEKLLLQFKPLEITIKINKPQAIKQIPNVGVIINRLLS